MIETDYIVSVIFELVIRYNDGACRCMYFATQSEAARAMRVRRPLLGNGAESIKSMELNECSLYKTIRDCALS